MLGIVMEKECILEPGDIVTTDGSPHLEVIEDQGERALVKRPSGEEFKLNKRYMNSVFRDDELVYGTIFVDEMKKTPR